MQKPKDLEKLADPPIITLCMTGEFVYLFDKLNNRCQLGIPNFDKTHELSIDVTDDSSVTTTLSIRKLKRPLYLRSSTKQRQITFDQGGGPLVRKQFPDARQLQHICWLPHFEQLFGTKDLHYDMDQLQPSIFIPNAFFFTYELS